MDKVEKALRRLSAKERSWVKDILLRLGSGDYAGLDVKRLKGHSEIFRVRKGDIRIIYRLRDKQIFVLAIERRRETTYK